MGRSTRLSLANTEFYLIGRLISIFHARFCYRFGLEEGFSFKIDEFVSERSRGIVDRLDHNVIVDRHSMLEL